MGIWGRVARTTRRMKKQNTAVGLIVAGCYCWNCMYCVVYVHWDFFTGTITIISNGWLFIPLLLFPLAAGAAAFNFFPPCKYPLFLSSSSSERQPTTSMWLRPHNLKNEPDERYCSRSQSTTTICTTIQPPKKLDLYFFSANVMLACFFFLAKFGPVRLLLFLFLPSFIFPLHMHACVYFSPSCSSSSSSLPLRGVLDQSLSFLPSLLLLRYVHNSCSLALEKKKKDLASQQVVWAEKPTELDWVSVFSRRLLPPSSTSMPLLILYVRTYSTTTVCVYALPDRKIYFPPSSSKVFLLSLLLFFVFSSSIQLYSPLLYFFSFSS